MKKVSIIIPVYNASAFIKNCIDSVRSQTMTDGVECILIDDCSIDNTLDNIQSLIENETLTLRNGIKDAYETLRYEDHSSNVTFRLLCQERNQGPSAARNRGIREAKGEYVFFLDADDTITPDCIELLYGLAKQHDADYVQGKYETSYEDENVPSSVNGLYTPLGLPVSGEQKRLSTYGAQENEDNIELLNSSTIDPSTPLVLTDRKEIKRLLLNHNKIQFTPHNRLVRRQMIIDNGLFFNEAIKVREDFLWMTFVAKYVKRFASCDKPTYNRGYNEESLTNNINKEREIAGYCVLIETMVANYDRFQLGYQKELALEALMMALKAGYYHDEAERQHLIEVVMSKNNFIENILLKLFLRTYNPKLLHLLVRIYKIKD